jgi:hypothetical protein
VTPVRLLAAFCLLWLAACGGPAEPRWAPDDQIAKYGWIPDGPPELRLYTVVSTRNGSGAHSGLLIATPRERILFDPAGTFALPSAPERNDVLYGVTPRILAVYVDYHARETYDVVEQRLPVSAAEAERVAQLVKAYGAVPKAQCTLSITRILRDAGFGAMTTSYFPQSARADFANLPGVSERVISDDDADKNHGVLIAAMSG